MGYGGDRVAVRGAVLGSERQGAGAEPYGDIVELHPGDAEYDGVVTEFGYEHGNPFVVVEDRQGDAGGVGDVS